MPGQPVVAIPRSRATRSLPVVGRVQGTKFFLSDVRLYNPRPTDRRSRSTTSRRAGAARTRSGRRATVGAGQVLALNDVICSEFGYDRSIGELTVVGPDTGFLATSRAYTQSANGTFGLFVPGFRSSDGPRPGQGRATANGLSKDAQFHTNAGFTEVSGAPVTVRIDLLDCERHPPRVDDPRRAPPNRTRPHDRHHRRPRSRSRRPTSASTSPSRARTGRVVPFATLIDDATGDGLFEAAGDPAPLVRRRS